MQLESCINYLMNRAQQAITQLFRDRLSEFQVTPVQYTVLKCLWTEDGLPPKQLADLIAVDRPAVTGILDRLEAKELIVREPDSSDRRGVNIYLTEKGRALEEPINKVVDDTHQSVLENLGPEDAEFLLTALKQLTRIEP